MTLNNKIRKALYGPVLYGAFLFLPLFSEGQILFDSVCNSAFQSVLSLKFLKADDLIKTERKKNPSNAFPFFIEDYRDFLKAFISEEDKEIENYCKSFDSRTERIRDNSAKSPFPDYMEADMHLRMSLVKIKSADFLSAASGLASAYRLFEKNQKSFPDFLPNKSGLGVLHILAGSVPEKYQGLLSVLGFEGNVEQGISELQQVVNYRGNDPFYRICSVQALFYLAVTEGNNPLDKKRSYHILNVFPIQDYPFLTSTNPFYIFIRGAICLRSGTNDEAIKTLSSYSRKTDEFPFFYLNYLLGKAKLNRLDKDADYHLRIFVTSFKGKTYLKSAYERLAWASLIKGEGKSFEMYRKMTLIAGIARSEADKQAEKEMSANSAISVSLLKARLLFDGGYYQKAMDLLTGINVHEVLKSTKDITEYNYRLGRVCQEMGKTGQANNYFDKTIELGRNESWYFAANAALQKGIMLENAGKYSDAEMAYNDCLSMDPDEYKSALDDKARAGIMRVKKHLKTARQ